MTIAKKADVLRRTFREADIVARLAGIMAREIGLDAHVTVRAAFLHDIGKAIDREMQGTHLELGIDFLRKHGHWVVCAIRLSPVLRTMISLPAGLVHMRRWVFVVFTMIANLFATIMLLR